MNPKLILGLLVLIALTAIPTIVDGQRRFRWGTDSEVATIAEQLEMLPKQIGDWECTNETELDANSADLLLPFASITRTYSNQREQLNVNLLILLGPTGPTAVHTPDICFDSRNFKKIGERKAISVDSDSTFGKKTESRFFRTEFISRDINQNGLKSVYGWRTKDGPWIAAKQPRWHFAESRYLFKLQATSIFPNTEQMQDSRLLENFVAELERELESSVFNPTLSP